MIEPRANLYVLFEGSRGCRRPVSARPRAPRSGIKVRVAVERDALVTEQLFVLHRRGDGDLVIGASTHRQNVEALLARLGRAAPAYEISAIPIVRPDVHARI